MQRVPMTLDGAESLREELNTLKTVKRPRVVTAIAEARAHGDLKENAEYHAARDQQSFIEGRIQKIEAALSHAQIIDISSLENTGRIVFGATVHLVNSHEGHEVIYKIVGDDEADIKHHKIAISAPIARALIGKEEGDEVEVETPKGSILYEILKVEYI